MHSLWAFFFWSLSKFRYYWLDTDMWSNSLYIYDCTCAHRPKTSIRILQSRVEHFYHNKGGNTHFFAFTFDTHLSLFSAISDILKSRKIRFECYTHYESSWIVFWGFEQQKISHNNIHKNASEKAALRFDSYFDTFIIRCRCVKFRQIIFESIHIFKFGEKRWSFKITTFFVISAIKLLGLLPVNARNWDMLGSI